MRPRKKGQQYEICYRCPGYTKPIYERFPTYEAANLRIAQIEYEKSIGEFRPPKQMPIQAKRAQKKFITVSELLDEYVQVYGLNHWETPSCPAISTALSITSNPIWAMWQ